jgi:hypothetical protein
MPLRAPKVAVWDNPRIDRRAPGSGINAAPRLGEVCIFMLALD